MLNSGYCPRPPTLASGPAQIGLQVSVFLAPHFEQTKCLATGGAGMRLGNPRLPGSMYRWLRTA
jgi:hypothetical protein